MTADWTVIEPDLVRLIADKSFDIVCRLDGTGTIRWVADSVSESLGWTPEQLLGRLMLDFVDPRDLSFASALGEGVGAGHTVGAEPDERPALRWRTPDGGIRWMSGTGIPHTDSEGRLTGAIVTLRDVTDLVEARLKAEAYVQQWRATVDNMLDPFVVLTAVRDDEGAICDFVFTIANAAAATDQNVAIEELVDKRFLTLFPHLQDDGIFAAYAAVVETGEPLILDDTEVYNDVLAQSRRYDIRGAKAGDALVLTWRDVTQRHAMQKRLAEQEAVYRMATESAYDAILQVDERGVVLWASPSFQHLAGYVPADLMGKSAFMLVAPEDLAEIQDAFGAALAGRPVPRSEVTIVTADGGRKWVKFRSRLVEDSGAGTSLMTMLRDIDDEVTARLALEQSLMQDPLTGIVTWNALRTDLASSTGAVRALLCLSVDRLRAINEAVSYAGGDDVLVEVAKRVADAIPPQARLARIAGNEFVIGVPELADRTLLAIFAEQISAAVAKPVTVGGEEIQPTISIGIAQ
ncbi:MAG: PAS domain S-box protein, partial [Candidatus Nanopelagicales bacterium]